MEDRPIKTDGQDAAQPSPSSQRASRPKRVGRGPARPVACRTRAARKEMGHGPKVESRGLGHMNYGQSFFSVYFYFFSEAVLVGFCLFFRQFSSIFFYTKIIQRNFCLEKKKSKRKASAKYKVHEFLIRVFPAANREMCSF